MTPDKTFTDQGLTGANRARPGLREALAACRARPREGMQVAKAKVASGETAPAFQKKQEAYLVSVHLAGTHTTVEPADLFAVARSTV